MLFTRSRLGLWNMGLRKSVAGLWHFTHLRNIFNYFDSTLYILRTIRLNLTIFCICINIDKIWVGIVMCWFVFFKELWPLSHAQHLTNELSEFDIILSICIHIIELSVGTVMRKSVQIYNRVMALDLSQKFVSAQYLKNESLLFYKMLFILWYWHDLGWYRFAWICANL